MEKNTVVLSIGEYNELRDLRTKLEEGKSLCISYYGGSNWYRTTDEVMIEIEKYNKELADKLKEKDDLIKIISEMSIQEFRRWRKHYNNYEGY